MGFAASPKPLDWHAVNGRENFGTQNSIRNVRGGDAAVVEQNQPIGESSRRCSTRGRRR